MISKKSFDYINRELLLYKLPMCNNDGKINGGLYKESRACIKINSICTHLFVESWVKQ